MSEPKLPDPRLTHLDENGTRFPLLSLDKVELVEQAVRKHLLQHYAEIAEVSQLIPAERFALLKDSVPADVDLEQLFAYARSATGIRRILTESVGDNPAINTYIGLDGANLALAVCGFCKRMTPAEVDQRMQELADRMFGLKQQEDAYARRKAALDQGEDDSDPPQGDGVSPPGGGSASE
jgi:hypothetical protein